MTTWNSKGQTWKSMAACQSLVKDWSYTHSNLNPVTSCTQVAPMQLLGYSIALCGFVWYSLTPGNPKSAPATSTQLSDTGKQPEDSSIRVLKIGSRSHGLLQKS